MDSRKKVSKNLFGNRGPKQSSSVGSSPINSSPQKTEVIIIEDSPPRKAKHQSSGPIPPTVHGKQDESGRQTSNIICLSSDTEVLPVISDATESDISTARYFGNVHGAGPSNKFGAWNKDDFNNWYEEYKSRLQLEKSFGQYKSE
ncbi:hypothetical protein Pyn_37974 [Prunus yedoensis var. nudiflora]|uniref:Uncharacterized protein n=1 Tax=Prunus yedoensis var. nudiflora TaxID=2094558 RepID=A0A314Z7V8_PRUYE|nr:hypothetical protein Pyn_37974 [Prunus yedoensis var. nudiflora]